MDEQTKQALNAFVQRAIDATERAGDFAAEQAPMVVQEYITRGLVANLVSAVGCLLITAILLFTVWRAYRWMKSDDGDEIAMFPMTIFGACAGMASVAAFNFAQDALLIYVAPRVYIIEQLRRLI